MRRKVYEIYHVLGYESFQDRSTYLWVGDETKRGSVNVEPSLLKNIGHYLGWGLGNIYLSPYLVAD